jgi:hypothetical protein
MQARGGGVNTSSRAVSKAGHVCQERLHLVPGLRERVGEAGRRAAGCDELDNVVHARLSAVQLKLLEAALSLAGLGTGIGRRSGSSSPEKRCV